MSATGTQDSDAAAKASAIARQFVAARLEMRHIPYYPGQIPETLAQSYAIQDIAIGRFPDEVVGWKVGGVPPAHQERLGAHRTAGVIFARNVWPASDDAVVSLPVIEDGFAAIESEFIARVGADVDPAKTVWTIDEAAQAIDKIFVGVELAGSPLATINDLGPTVSASDFGNNGGLVVGPELENWRARLDQVEVETVINGASVGTGGSQSLAGGALESVRFLLEHSAGRGRPLKAGTLISTGAVTGVHRAQIGDEAISRFKGIAEIRCSVVKAG